MLFAFALGDGFDGGEGHFDASVGCDFENGLGSICADDGGVEASGGHDTVAGFKAFAVGGFFFSFLALRADKEEIENEDECHHHDGSFPTIGDVE